MPEGLTVSNRAALASVDAMLSMGARPAGDVHRALAGIHGITDDRARKQCLELVCDGKIEIRGAGDYALPKGRRVQS